MAETDIASIVAPPSEPSSTGDTMPAAAPAPMPQSPMVMMRGGTLTGAYERHLQQQKHQAAQARKIEDARTRAAQNNPDEARQYQHAVGGNRKYPGIVLEVRHPKDRTTVLDYIECELTVEDDGGLVLVMACHKCYHRTGDASNLTVRQKHRHFELDLKRQGEIWVDPKNPNHIVTLAGTITTTETITCPNLGCGMKFMIDNSVLREK